VDALGVAVVDVLPEQASQVLFMELDDGLLLSASKERQEASTYCDGEGDQRSHTGRILDGLGLRKKAESEAVLSLCSACEQRLSAEKASRINKDEY